MATSTSNGSGLDGDIEVSPAIFQDLSNLEKEFAVVELDALRKKEFNLKPLYERRSAIIDQLPSFWPQVLLNGPQEFQSILSHEVEDDEEENDTNLTNGGTGNVAGGNLDIATISAIKNVTIERYQIRSESEGEPRSLRFTFEFEKNPVFEDTKVVKEFEYISHPDGESGGLVSQPVTFQWTKKGKKLIQAKTGGLLDLAVELYQAEAAAKFNVNTKGGSQKGEEVDIVGREGLWQYEKLREKLEKLEDQSMEGDVDAPEGCWLDWFGYRGPVDIGKAKSPTTATSKVSKTKQNGTNGAEEEDKDEFEGFDDGDDDGDDDDDDDELNGLLEVEIFPAGEEVAIALADDLWPNVMEYFMAAQDPLDDDDDNDDDEDLLDMEDIDDDEDAPELINADEMVDIVDNKKEQKTSSNPSARPNKKQRTK